MPNILNRWIPRLRAYGQIRTMKILGIHSKVHRLQTGERMRLRVNDVLTRALLQENVFEPAVRSVMNQHVKPGMVVLDIGANIGYFSLRLSSLVGVNGRVIAFEPNPVVLDELKFNLALNGTKNVDVVASALAESDGEAEFCFPEIGMEAHGSLRPNDTFKVQKRSVVKVARLDSILEAKGIRKVDFVKIDVEGAERLVIRGGERLLAQLPAPVFIFEAAEILCQAFGYRLYELLTEFESRGYQAREADYGCWVAEV